MSLIKSNKQKEEKTIALEDIDYLIAAQRMSEITTSLESNQEELLHACDIAESLKNLDMVMESMKEIDVIDAALIEVVGNIAGASSGVHASYFTPSMEAEEDTGPSIKSKIKAIYDKIIEMLRLIFSKVKAYIAYMFTSSHKVAKDYEALGDRIKNYNFVNAKTITLKDMAYAKGGPKAVIDGLAKLDVAAKTVLSMGPKILDAQIKYIYEADSNAILTDSQHLKTIANCSLTAARGGDIVASGTEMDNPIVHSKPMLNNVQIVTYVFDDEANLDDLFHRAFSSRTGFSYGNEEDEAGSSTFIMNHDLASKIFEGLRPLINSLVDKNDSSSFTSILTAIDKEGDKILQWLHQKQASITVTENSGLDTLQKDLLYKTSLKLIGTAQLQAIKRSHQILESTVMAVMSYLNQCLALPKPVQKPAAAVAEAT